MVGSRSFNPMPAGKEMEIGIQSGRSAFGLLSVRHETRRPIEACEQDLAAPALDEPLADLGQPRGVLHRLQLLGEALCYLVAELPGRLSPHQVHLALGLAFCLTFSVPFRPLLRHPLLHPLPQYGLRLRPILLRRGGGGCRASLSVHLPYPLAHRPAERLIPRRRQPCVERTECRSRVLVAAASREPHERSHEIAPVRQRCVSIVTGVEQKVSPRGLVRYEERAARRRIGGATGRTGWSESGIGGREPGRGGSS